MELFFKKKRKDRFLRRFYRDTLQGKANHSQSDGGCFSYFFMDFSFYSAAGGASAVSASSVAASDVQRVKLSRNSCMINVESL